MKEIKINRKQLTAAANATADWPAHCSWYTAIYYDREDCSIWAAEEQENSLPNYSESVICVMRTNKKESEESIIKNLKAAIKQQNEIEAWLEAHKNDSNTWII